MNSSSHLKELKFYEFLFKIKYGLSGELMLQKKNY